ncbi:MAG TPA: enoyl-CoA hydratase-related protein [Phenylobacterium sp.]|uniref:enoyl-CoA hydratase/isomerase family protein n=1 Tax=Phenylobacterium sp. TaxID=1871053 RepID=UPI002B48D628|nr:enoyl-CoA hydratase-related protein [Phenylobacterium sp.]HKR89406.1 enoyl-CoA hydratase-related protein [Phenylobacterium sp.]
MANGVLFEVDGPVATITLNRPEVGNALDIPMSRELMELAIRCEGDAAIRCVVLTGAGKLFCGGGDMAAFAAAGEALPEFLREITTYLHSAISVFARMDKPLVTAINGSTAGAGIGLAILGDIALAEPTASFSLAYTGIGLTPDGGATWLLPRLIGLRRAQELCLTNRKVRAEEAASLGLVTRVVEAGTLAAETAKVAGDLAKGATAALGATRKMLVESTSNTLESQLQLESRVISDQSRNYEGQEGVTAFLEKRAPRFLKED